MKFQSFKEWLFLNEGGAAIPSSRSITYQEGQDLYNWVKKEIFPRLKISKEDAEIIGSYGKKVEGETHGDLDIVISAKVLMEKNNLTLDQLLNFIENTLSDLRLETKKFVGLRQVSSGITIPGTNDIAQVDFMLSPDLSWSKFIYYSPNLRKGESKYKGSFRNALLMAVISESFKKILKRTPEGDIGEIEYNVVRLPAGIWRTRKSFIGKRGLLKTGEILRDFDKFVTTEPQEVVDLAVGSKYSPEDISTFEKLWSIVINSKFIYSNKLENIMKKFAGNLRSMELNYPKEAIEAFPKIFKE